MKLSELPEQGDNRLTIMCHPGEINVQNDVADTVTIDPQATMACAAKVNANAWTWLKQQPRFMELLRCVFPDNKFNLPDHPLQMHGSGLQHTVGLILLVLDAQKQGKRPFIRFPETYLHPAQQLGLADLFLKLTPRG